jgi:hypothetical protein
LWTIRVTWSADKPEQEGINGRKTHGMEKEKT